MEEGSEDRIFSEKFTGCVGAFQIVTQDFLGTVPIKSIALYKVNVSKLVKNLGATAKIIRKKYENIVG